MIPIEFSFDEAMTLITLASHICENDKLLYWDFTGETKDPIVAAEATLQISLHIEKAKVVLAALDERNPTIMPLPRDGVTWKERMKDV